MDDAVARILAKLAEVRERGLESFGAASHDFLLNAPLSEAGVAEFEREYRVELPGDYRLFLIEAGDGGAGPYYGLPRLREAVIGGWKDDPVVLARPSPLRPGMPAGADWAEALGCRDDELFQGALSLGTQGCSLGMLLVVSGDHRGRVVYVDMDQAGIPYFVNDTGFLAWYERWLDEMLWGYVGNNFGLGLPGREADMVAALSDEGATPERKLEALTTLWRIPALETETLDLVEALLSDESADVRRMSVALLGRGGRAETPARLGLLRDPDPTVRKATLSALAEGPATLWGPAASEALADADADVVFRALCLLKNARLLTPVDLDPLFRSPLARVRRDALWAIATLPEGPSSVAVPEDLLDDPDPDVRHFAILHFGNSGSRRLVGRLLDMLRREPDPDLAICLTTALGSVGGKDAMRALIEATRHPDGFVRQNAARWLTVFDDPDATEALRALLDDHETPERLDERGLLSRATNQSVADVARIALGDDRPPSWPRPCLTPRGPNP